MNGRLSAFVAVVLASMAGAQSLAIRGSVGEPASDGISSLAVAGAEVSLAEFLPVDGFITRVPFATTYTDSRGAFQFRAEHAGAYYIEVKKDGYGGLGAGETDYTGTPVTLTAGPSPAPLNLLITRRGEITGRVIDEDGKAVAGLKVYVQPGAPAASAAFLEVAAVTGEDGSFTAQKLKPGPYAVRIAPRSGDMEKVIPRYSEDDLKVVDEDMEVSYWPGGLPTPSASIPVSGGSSANIGTLKVRKTSYYRVHVSVPAADCEAGEKWNLTVRDSDGSFLGLPGRDQGNVPCAKDFLVANLKPGAYWFGLSAAQEGQGAWALAEVRISNKNEEVVLRLTQDAGIAGRIVAADESVAPPRSAGIMVLMRAAISGFGSEFVPLKPDGTFTTPSLKGPRHSVSVMNLGPQYYVKEIRLNKAPAAGGFIDVSPGSDQQLEIVVDDKPGVVTGFVADGDKPAAQVLVRLLAWPIAPNTPRAASMTNQEGKFSIPGLAPGEYRAVAIPAQIAGNTGISDAALAELALRAEKISVERGGTSMVALKLSR